MSKGLFLLQRRRESIVFGGLLLASPFILFFIGQFVSPALTERETKAIKPLCFSALVLFLLGSAFSFFLLMPSTVRIAIELNQAMGLETRWTAGNYFTTLTWLVLGTGAVFEFPLVIVLLVWLGVLTTEFLRKYRRHAIVLIFVIAAIVTPTPDPVTQTIFAAPLYALFEISILVSSRVEKRKRIARAAVWVCSDECYMTGQNLQINGGLTLRRNPRPEEIGAAVGAAMAALNA